MIFSSSSTTTATVLDTHIHTHTRTHQSNRFKTMRSTSDAQVRKAMAKIERSGKAKDGALRYNAKGVKAFMEKKTSLW
jgi:hypothetical protein